MILPQKVGQANENWYGPVGERLIVATAWGDVFSAIPIYLAVPFTIRRLCFGSQAFAADEQLGIMGVYSIENGVPVDLLGTTEEFDLADDPTTATGYPLTAPLALSPGWYALALFVGNPTGAEPVEAQVACIAQRMESPIAGMLGQNLGGVTSVTDTNRASGWFANGAGAYASAPLPAVFPPPLAYENGNAPLVVFSDVEIE